MANKIKEDVFTMLESLQITDGRRMLKEQLNNYYGWEDEHMVTGMQINTKWKALKTTYRNEHQQASKSGKCFLL